MGEDSFKDAEEEMLERELFGGDFTHADELGTQIPPTSGGDGFVVDVKGAKLAKRARPDGDDDQNGESEREELFGAFGSPHALTCLNCPISCIQ
jgi:hypothetical protein